MDDSLNEILDDFIKESKSLLEELLNILEKLEEDSSQVVKLEEYGQIADRMMGGAKNIAVNFAEKDLFFEKIIQFTELCKIVGYKASQINDNPQFFNVSVAFLLDATEMLDLMLTNFKKEKRILIKEYLSQTFLDRLKWLSEHFDKNTRSSVAVTNDQGEATTQEQIDEILKKLGI